jgi:hypothetical protein
MKFNVSKASLLALSLAASSIVDRLFGVAVVGTGTAAATGGTASGTAGSGDQSPCPCLLR